MPNLESPNQLNNLLSRCVLKDAGAFESLYKLTSPKLFALSLRIVKKQEWAEDILQEGFINIWNNADQYRGDKGSAMTWMTRIMRNKAIDHIRKKPQKELQDEGILDAVASTEHGPLDHLYDAGTSEALKSCLDELDTAQQNAITMAYYQGFTHQELAQALSKPIGTIKSWIRRGLQKLKGCLSL